MDIGPLFQTPAEVARSALDADVHVIGVSSQAAGHLTLIPALMDELKKEGMEHVMVVAGGIIPEPVRGCGRVAPGTEVPCRRGVCCWRVGGGLPPTLGNGKPAACLHQLPPPNKQVNK